MSDFLSGIEEKYTKDLLKGRLNIEANVISCLLKEPILLDDSKLDKEFFITSNGSFLFSMIRHLRKKNLYTLDEVSISSNLNEDALEMYNDMGGWEQISHAIDIINTDNYEAYLDILYRENIILKMYKDGFALDKPIEIQVKDKIKKVMPLKLFRKLSSQEVIEWYESKLAGYEIAGSSKVLEDEEVDFTDEFFLSYEEGEQNGVPIGSADVNIDDENIKVFPWLSNQINGFQEGTFNMVGGYSSVGKTAYWTNIIMSLLAQNRKILFVSNEERAKELKTRIIIWCLYRVFKYKHLSKKKLTSGKIDDNDRDMLKKFQTWWREHEYNKRFKFVTIEDADMALVKKKIRENALKHGYDTFIYDTFKIDVDDMNAARTDLRLVKDSRELDKVARKYNLIGLASLQLAEATKGKLFLDSSTLSNSKQIKEILHNLLLMRNVYPEEIFKQNDKDGKPKYGKYYCNPFRRSKNDEGKWVETPYKLDENATYRMLFVEKARTGENSSDNGVAYLLKYNGDYAVFIEDCMCRPKHSFIQ